MTTATTTRRGSTPVPGFTTDTAVTATTSSPALSTAGLITILVGVLLPLIDFFIVNVALPTMQHDLHATTALLELVVSGYATAYAVLLVLGGRLGDAHGRKRLFLIGIAAFTITSLLCGIAPSATTLVIARVLQGASAALMVPQTLSTIQATGNPASRSKALGWYGATGGLAAVTGQLLGGVLVSANIAGSGWRAIFFVNIPVGIVGLVLAARYVPETHAVRRTPIDVRGTLLLALTLIAVLIPLTEGRALGWPLWSWVLLGLAPLSAAVFALVERSLERTGGAPLVPPSVLEHASMRRGLLLAVPFFATFGAFMFVYALVTQTYLGFSALRAGVAMGPMAVLFLVTSLATTRLVARYGRKVIGAGATIQLVGLLVLIATLLAWWPQVSAVDLMPGLAIMGIGQALMLSPLVRIVLSEVPQELAGAGSGVLTTTQQTSLALGVALIGSVFLTLASPSHLGPLHAAVVILAVQSVVALGLAVGSRLLPKGGRPVISRRDAVASEAYASTPQPASSSR
jgi:EmrB/QacA subfamily drug resistance transporter